MDIRTPITAARKGVVIRVREDVTDGTFGFENINWIWIQHDDDTIAAYMHLTRNGALVEEGDLVRQSEVIGLSGDTGTLGLPHLHFAVWEGSGSIPVTFRNISPSAPGGLIRGEVYTALEEERKPSDSLIPVLMDLLLDE